MGPDELDLIRASGWRAFPPRLDWQPIFYPVPTEEYATMIARDWNVKATGAGYVTTFEVDTDYLADFDVQEVGGRELREYWIPAEELEEFNTHIVGTIRLVSEWSGDPPSGSSGKRTTERSNLGHQLGRSARWTFRRRLSQLIISLSCPSFSRTRPPVAAAFQCLGHG